MQPDTISKLLSINEQFYQTFAGQFSQTRQRLQPGVRKLLPDLLNLPSLLDLGCGNGELARQLAQLGYPGRYTGLDFSPDLLAYASQGLPNTFQSRFLQASLVEPHWEANLPQPSYSAVLAFAVLHHLPGADLRRSVLLRLHSLLEPTGIFIHSNWQFLRSKRLQARIQPWALVGFQESDLDPGDYLLDWRQGGTGLRYVHHYSEQELLDLAAETGFQIRQAFYSDGKSGDLSLYQVWEPIAPKKPTSG